MANYYGGRMSPSPLTEKELKDLLTQGNTFKSSLESEGVFWEDNTEDGAYYAGIIVVETGEMFGTHLVFPGGRLSID
jgi:hypothetical protein